MFDHVLAIIFSSFIEFMNPCVAYLIHKIELKKENTQELFMVVHVYNPSIQQLCQKDLSSGTALAIQQQPGQLQPDQSQIKGTGEAIGNILTVDMCMILSLGKWQRCHRKNSGRACTHAEEHQAGRNSVTGHCPPRWELPAPRAGNVQTSVSLSFQSCDYCPYGTHTSQY